MANYGQRPMPRTLLWALAFSLALHLALFFGPQLRVPTQPPPPMPLQVKLLSPPEPSLKGALKEKKPRQRTQPKHRQPRKHRAHPAPKKKAAPPAAVQPPPAPATPPVPRPPARPAPETAPAAAAPARKAPAKHDAGKAAAARPDKGKAMPVEAEIRYTLFKGTQGLMVGQTIHSWRIRDGRYYVTSVTEATGLFSLFKPGRLVQTSEGSITAGGLAPDAFWIQRGQSAATTDFAHFDWDNKTLTLGSYGNSRTVALPAHTQDLLSFVYQMGFGGPPTGTLHLHVTDGRRLSNYDYRVVGVETLDTPMGKKIKALHLTRLHLPGENGTDIWLGVDYDYLPVKVRLTDKEGDSAEQVIRSIRLINPKNALKSPPSSP